jgi:intracellular multiplication protein IcmC
MIVKIIHKIILTFIRPHISGVMIALIFFIAIYPMPAIAAITYDVQDILKNMRGLLHPFLLLILGVSFTGGVWMIFRGLGMFKVFGQAQTQMSRPGELGGPLLYMLVGTILIYLPSTSSIVGQTIFGSDQVDIFEGGTLYLARGGYASTRILSYAAVGVESQWADLTDTIILYIQFIGFLAFVRGWFIISHAGQPGTQPGVISKGIVHLIGGICAVNFIPLVEILHNTIIG